jgi:hypothetical protein
MLSLFSLILSSSGYFLFSSRISWLMTLSGCLKQLDNLSEETKSWCSKRCWMICLVIKKFIKKRTIIWSSILKMPLTYLPKTRRQALWPASVKYQLYPFTIQSLRPRVHLVNNLVILFSPKPHAFLFAPGRSGKSLYHFRIPVLKGHWYG